MIIILLLIYTQALIIPTTIDQYTRQADWGMIFMVILYMEVNLVIFDVQNYLFYIYNIAAQYCLTN